MVTTPAPTLPNLQPATAPRTAGTPNPTTAPPGGLARLTTPALELARSEALRDADVLAMGLRAGVNGFRAAQVVNELKGLRIKIMCINWEIERRGEVTA